MATFNFTFDPGTTVQQMVGFEMAGRVWSRYLSDPVTINLHVGVSSNLPTNVIGGALPGFQANRAYTTVRDRLYADATSTDDATATNGIRNYNKYDDFSMRHPDIDPKTQLHATVDNFVESSLDWYNNAPATTWNNWFSDADRLAYGGKTYIDIKKNVYGSDMALTRANAKALGVSLDQVGSKTLDGYILLSDLSNFSNVVWNYDYTRSNAAGSNSLDFLSVALHEVGHTLGFVSSIDRPDWLKPFFTSTSGQISDIWNLATMGTYFNDALARTNFATPLDLFRYNLTNTSHWGGWRDLSVGGTAMFSLDGTTEIAKFATGLEQTLGGSGLQASHWQGTTGSSGIMNPSLGLGVRRNIGSLDLRGMDVIGWNLANNSNAVQTIDLSTLQTQAAQVLEARNRNSATVTTTTNALAWYGQNLTRSLTPLVINRDTEITTMLVDSQVYNLTRVAGSSSTGTVTRQVLASMLEQQQGFRSELWEVAPADAPTLHVEITSLGADVSTLIAGTTAEPLVLGLTSASTTTEVPLRLMPPMLQIQVSWLDSGMDHRFVAGPWTELMSGVGGETSDATIQTAAIAGSLPLGSGMDAPDYDSQLGGRLFTPIMDTEKSMDDRASSFEFSSELDLLLG